MEEQNSYIGADPLSILPLWRKIKPEKNRSKDHRLMGYWGRESVLLSVKLLQSLTFERRALAGARRRWEQQKEQWVLSGWRTLLPGSRYCSTPNKGECFQMGQWRVIGEARRIGPKAGGAGREGAAMPLGIDA